MEKKTILIADSQRLFAECLAGMLSRLDDMWTLEELPATGPAAVEAAAVWTPDIVLLDHWIPGMDATVVLSSILARVKDVKILVLSWFHGPDHIQSALRAGASGYLPKSISLSQLAEAIRKANRGEVPVFIEELGHMVQHLTTRADESLAIAKRFEHLTPREIQILTVLAGGRPIEEVANGLSISPHTLKTHIRNILSKTGARSHGEAVGLALRCGLIQI
ncbi:MAG: response regulator [Actinomycetota bacterium]